MKTHSNQIPLPYELNLLYTGESELIVTENVQEITTINPETNESEISYEFDLYTIILAKTRDSLALRESLKNADNLNSWILYCKETEIDKLSTELRTKRDKLLLDSDWTVYVDSPLSEEEKAKWITYRKELRDLTLIPGFPYNVEFPKAPAIKK